MTEQLERQIIQLIATDRLDVPISSMSGKLKRAKPKIAKTIDLCGERFEGERTFAYVRDEEGTKARGMSEAINIFCEKHLQYGQELRGLIAEQRTTREPHLYFGMQEGRRLTSGDYIDVMASLGFSEAKAEAMYQELMDASRKIVKKRQETTRSILVG